jgi:hypothetical protein
MNQFKIGDKVVAVKKDVAYLELGKEYIIDYIYSRDSVMVKGIHIVFHASCFELFVETPQEDYKAMKFRVESPEHSKEVQEALFSMGFCWRSHGKNVMFTEKMDYNWLYTDVDGSVWRTYKNEQNSWMIDAEEYTIKTTKTYELVPVVTEAIEETVELMGQKYSKKELEDALRSLKPVN